MSPDAGKRYLESLPMIILHMCGAINPMNPMTPVNERQDAVTSVQTISPLRLNAITSTPRLVATSSPADIALILSAMFIRYIPQMITIGVRIIIELHDEPEKFPMIHSVISLS